jgi:hypothetical protein
VKASCPLSARRTKESISSGMGFASGRRRATGECPAESSNRTSPPWRTGPPDIEPARPGRWAGIRATRRAAGAPGTAAPARPAHTRRPPRWCRTRANRPASRDPSPPFTPPRRCNGRLRDTNRRRFGHSGFTARIHSIGIDWPADQRLSSAAQRRGPPERSVGNQGHRTPAVSNARDIAISAAWRNLQAFESTGWSVMATSVTRRWPAGTPLERASQQMTLRLPRCRVSKAPPLGR